jgi:hypothetical protein
VTSEQAKRLNKLESNLARGWRWHNNDFNVLVEELDWLIGVCRRLDTERERLEKALRNVMNMMRGDVVQGPVSYMREADDALAAQQKENADAK